MVENLVSNFVKSEPFYKFGVGEKRKPFREGITHAFEMHKNENPFGVSPKAVAAMVDACSRSNRYPDISAASLCKKLAEKHGVKPENIMVTQGGTSSLGFIAEMFIKPGDEVMVAPPTYPNYYNLTQKNDGVLVEIPTDENYEPRFDKMLEAITDKTKIIFLANPNNPTATICDDKKLLEFIRRLPKHVVMVVDEAYLEFVEREGYQSMINYISDDLNLIIVKAFSKIYGMAGARIGYAVSNREIISYLKTDGTGYCCNRVGLEGAEAALDDEEFVKMTIEKNREGRAYLTSEMEKMGFRVWPSHTNFIYFDAHMPPSHMASELYTFGVNIRGDFTQCRLSIGTMEQNRIAVAAMQQIVREYNEANK